MINFLNFLIFFTIFNVHTVTTKIVKDPLPIDYNVEIDKVLNGIEEVVRNQNETEFSSFFSESFDAEDWYRKFLKPLTMEQAATYSLSRFGDVKDGKFVQFTESIRLNDSMTRRTPFDAVFIETPSENPSEIGRKGLVIDSLTVHGADEN